MHSGFAASRSCQNPSAQTLFSTLPFAIASNPSSTQDTDISPHTHSRTSIQEPKGKAFPGKVTDQTETEQIPQRIPLCTEFPASSNPQFIKGNILLGSAWEGMISLVSALCTVQIFRALSFLQVSVFRADLIYGFIATALQHYSSELQITAGRRSTGMVKDEALTHTKVGENTRSRMASYNLYYYQHPALLFSCSNTASWCKPQHQWYHAPHGIFQS